MVFNPRAITHLPVCPWLLRPGAPALLHLQDGTAQQHEKSDRIQNHEHPNHHNCINAAVAHQPLWFGFPFPA